MEPFRLYGKLAAEIKEGQTFIAEKSSVEGRGIVIMHLVEDNS